MSYGLTLDQIVSYSTDKEWKYRFLDRTSKSDQDMNRYKLLSISNLGIYWNEKDKSVMNGQDCK